MTFVIAGMPSFNIYAHCLRPKLAPIVFAILNDPIGDGFVQSLARPNKWGSLDLPPA